MHLHLITLVLNGEPWIRRHLPELEKLKHRWTWHIMEGVAAPHHDTSWIASQSPSLSTDGTHEYLESLSCHPHVRVTSRLLWDGKIEMVNHPFSQPGVITEPSVIIQQDSDECWRADQYDQIMLAFRQRQSLRTMQFKCRYFVGPDVVAHGEDCYGLNPGEWVRAWRYQRGFRFITHEPPNFAGNRGAIMDRNVTERMGLVFDHFAYATEAQVKYKERVYKYAGAVDAWKKLQANTEWPCKLRTYLPWVDERAEAVRIGEKFLA